MVRELWADILPKYLTFISHMKPILNEIRTIVMELDVNQPLTTQILDLKRKGEEEKINIKSGSIKRLAEFTANYRLNVYKVINDYITQKRDEFPLIKDNEKIARYETYSEESQGKFRTIKQYIIFFLSEAIDVLDFLSNITSIEQNNYKNTYLYKLVKFIEERLFPRGNNIKEIYEKSLKYSSEFYECQRHLLLPHTYYREKLENPDFFMIPGITPKVYQIMNNIISLFNLDPNYGHYPEMDNYELPLVQKQDIFLPYIDSISHEEEESIEKISERFGLQLIDIIFITPKEEFIKILQSYNFLKEEIQPDGIIRLVPQFSNETLLLYYLAFASYRRGFLSKELINWISMNFAFLIYMGILKWKLTDDNIFYNIFKDLQANEKILPYLMKLICFPNFLGLDKMKIRDSPQYRKEIFNFIGSQIDNLKDFIDEIAKYCENFDK